MNNIQLISVNYKSSFMLQHSNISHLAFVLSICIFILCIYTSILRCKVLNCIDFFQVYHLLSALTTDNTGMSYNFSYLFTFSPGHSIAECYNSCICSVIPIIIIGGLVILLLTFCVIVYLNRQRQSQTNQQTNKEIYNFIYRIIYAFINWIELPAYSTAIVILINSSALSGEIIFAATTCLLIFILMLILPIYIQKKFKLKPLKPESQLNIQHPDHLCCCMIYTIIPSAESLHTLQKMVIATIIIITKTSSDRFGVVFIIIFTYAELLFAYQINKKFKQKKQTKSWLVWSIKWCNILGYLIFWLGIVYFMVNPQSFIKLNVDFVFCLLLMMLQMIDESLVSFANLCCVQINQIQNQHMPPVLNQIQTVNNSSHTFVHEADRESNGISLEQRNNQIIIQQIENQPNLEHLSSRQSPSNKNNLRDQQRQQEPPRTPTRQGRTIENNQPTAKKQPEIEVIDC